MRKNEAEAITMVVGKIQKQRGRVFLLEKGFEKKRTLFAVSIKPKQAEDVKVGDKILYREQAINSGVFVGIVRNK